MKKMLFAAVTLAAGLIGTSASPALAQKACLRIGEIYNWTALDDKTLIVEDNWHKKFKLKLIGTCYNLKFHENLGFRSIGGGGLGISCVTPGDLVISHEFGTGFSHCAITSIVPYTHEMEAADRAAEAAREQHDDGH